MSCVLITGCSSGFGARELRQGLDGPPYDELDREWEATRPALLGDGPPADAADVAMVIAEAVESTDARLRWPVGADADLALGAKDSMSFEDFEAAMRGVLGITW